MTRRCRRQMKSEKRQDGHGTGKTEFGSYFFQTWKTQGISSWLECGHPERTLFVTVVILLYYLIAPERFLPHPSFSIPIYPYPPHIHRCYRNTLRKNGALLQKFANEKFEIKRKFCIKKKFERIGKNM